MKLNRRQLRRLIFEETKAVASESKNIAEIKAALASLESSVGAWEKAANKASESVAGPEAHMSKVLKGLSAFWKENHMPKDPKAAAGRTTESIIREIEEALDSLLASDDDMMQM